MIIYDESAVTVWDEVVGCSLHLVARNLYHLLDIATHCVEIILSKLDDKDHAHICS